MTENEIAAIIVDAAYTIHQRLGPGLLESVYEATLAYELAKRKLPLRRQQAMPVVYEKHAYGCGLQSGFDCGGKGDRGNQINRRHRTRSSEAAFDLSSFNR
jgi:hypothetical protein